MSATGYAFQYLPEGPERDECLGLMRLGATFSSQRVGRRHGFVHNYLVEVGKGLGENRSFRALILELRYRALKDAVHGNDFFLHEVDMAAETVVWCEPGKDAYSMPFTTLRNKWTLALKKLSQVHP